MSDQYLFHLNFDVRHDAPAQLHAALAKRAEGIFPKEEDVCDLPGMVRTYLQSGGTPGDGVYCYQSRGPRQKFRDGKMVPAPFEPHEGSHSLRMAHTFHDDEYWNGGIFYPYWLFQFAAYDGPIGTMQQTNGHDPAAILTKAGDRIIETQLAYNPGKYWPMSGQGEPDPDTSMVIEKSTTIPLAEMMKSLSDFAEGYAWE